MTFIKRHTRAVVFCLISLMLTFIASVAFGNYQIGIGPEFIVKAFAKLFYLGVAMIFTHVIVKYVFPTVYNSTNTEAGEKTSHFQQWWHSIGPDACETCDPRLTLCIHTHIGVFIGVCLLLALAF